MTTSTLTKIIDGTISTGFGKLSIVSISLLSFIVTTRWLTIEDLGVFVLLKVIVSFLAKFSGFGLDDAITRFMAGTEDEAEKKTLVNTIISFRIFTIVITSFLAIIGKNLLFQLFGSSIYTDILVFIPILLTIESMNGLFFGIFAGNFNFRMIGLTDLINSILSFLAILVLVVWQDSGVMGRIHARLYATSLTFLFVLFFGNVRYKPKIDFTVLKKILKFSFPLYINYFLSFAFLRADTLIIGIYLGPAEIALYEIAKTIPDALEMMYEAFRQVYYSFISKFFILGEMIKASKMINNSIRLFSFVGFLGALIIFLFGSNIIVLLFQEKYLPSTTAFAILMMVFTFLIIESTYGYSLVAIGESNKPPVINVFHTAINFIGYILLIKPLGINGLALAGMFGSALAIPINIYFLKMKKVKTRYSLILLPILLLGVCLSMIYIFRPDDILSKTIIILVYIAGSYFLSIITKEDIKSVYSEGIHLAQRLKNKGK